MSRHFSHLNTAVSIIESYNGLTPLHLFLKGFFAQKKKYGSKDRKTISTLCYYYFRLGHGEKERSIKERILLAIYLCENEHNNILELLKPERNATINLPLQEKLHDVETFYASNIFKWKDELSNGIENGTFSLSFLIQPKLFIRVRPGYQSLVREKLIAANVYFEDIYEDCLAFDNGTKLEDVLKVNVEYVVQDFNSQRVGEFIKSTKYEIRNTKEEKKNMKEEGHEEAENVDPKSEIEATTSNIEHRTSNLERQTSVWDCCAASGGKAIMANDILKNIQLTVTDVRPTILQNLQQRFREAGIKNYSAYVADLTGPNKIENSPFDLVICDAPCSGSGTWGRTPEQLYYFKEEEIEKYSLLQKRIARNAIPHVKHGGYLLYITCSVFRAENEAVVKYIQKNSFLQLIQSEVLKGYSMKADTMFAALFQLK